ncbi:MAG: sialate O-acetylesterase [Kiritimatiellia bacterium]
MKRHLVLLAAGLSLLFAPRAPAAEPRPFLHPLFSDGAVLQRGTPVPVWGWAAPGETVTVEFAGQKASAIAGADGKWMARLPALEASDQPRVLRAAGTTTAAREVQNVVVGDVWICSGQSNMEMGVGMCNVPDEVAAADHPMIRLLTVPRKVSNEPLDLFSGSWTPCSPATVVANGWGGFSATGYFFGRELHRELKVPVGLIHSSWGGTICEAWTSAEDCAPAGLRRAGRRGSGGRRRATVRRHDPDTVEAWYGKNDPGTSAGWQKPAADDAGWASMNLPVAWENGGLPGYDGIAWFRKSFDAPADWAGKDLVLSLGPIDDMDTTFVNGVKVGAKDVWNQDRVYRIPGNLVQAGRNVIAIRVLDTAGAGGINGQPAQMHVGPEGAAAPVSLAGAWRMKDSAPMGRVAGLPVATSSNNPNVTTVLYNGMIAPLLPYAIKGAIWYQGESNAGRGYQYRALLPAMITDWRARFGVGDFPFYIVSLANFQQPPAQPSESDWAELREAQAMTAKNLKNCGLAVAIDIGDAVDIHPKNKMEVGRRLALAALAQVHGREVEYSGPWYKGMTVEDGRIRLAFDHAAGLAAKDGRLTGFAIAGEDRKFVWADAVIDGGTVVVSAVDVPKPVAVRYAWHANPVCNLVNAAGLPAVPFRTDDWPGVTANNK